MSAPATGRLEAFLLLSEVIVAQRGLPRDVGASYLEVLERPAVHRTFGFRPTDLARVLAIAPSLPGAHDPLAVLEQCIDGEKPLQAVVRLAAYLWYTACLPDPATGIPVKVVSVTAWNGGLVWDAIGATPLGQPGPYFGSWAYPPPVPITAPPAPAGPARRRRA